MRHLGLAKILVASLVSLASVFLPASGFAAFPVPKEVGLFRTYACPLTDNGPLIDGNLSDEAWQNAPWTDDFVDIQGNTLPAPRLRTRAKMLWDDEYFYVAAQMGEPHVWAKLAERDAVIYYDNDFEVFIDPDGDNHLYYELEINALGTEWDLLVVKPYRDGAPAVNAWDIQGLKTAVEIQGTLNDPSDKDTGWTVEIAIPWPVMAQCAGRSTPPAPGHIWRVNFSRVQWRTEIVDGKYEKLTDPDTGKSLPEDNWVWSPQGLIAMHYPEQWGEVLFVGNDFQDTHDRNLKRALNANAEHQSILHGRMLMDLYYQQRIWKEEHGRYAATMDELGFEPTMMAKDWSLEMQGSATRFLATLHTGPCTITVNEEGRLIRNPVTGDGAD